MTPPTVPEVLQAYANRGLFRDFRADPAAGDFDFVWMGHKPMRLRWNAAKRTMMFKDLLPNIPARSEMYGEVRDFLKERTEAGLPDHRRVDPRDFEILCQNRAGQVSIGLRLADGNQEEATNKLMLLVHEAFLMLNDRWLDYMHEEFGASLE
jgi:hypothetical protein